MKEQAEYLYPIELVKYKKEDLRTTVEGGLGADVVWAQSIRGIPKIWERLVQSINNLKNLSSDYSDIKIKTQTVAMKQNLFELDQVIKLVGSLGVDGISIMPVKGVPNLVPSIDEVKKYNAEVAPRVVELCKEYNFQVTRLSIYPFGEIENEIQRAQRGLYNLGSNKIPCIVPWVHTLINSDGAVYTCCSMYSRKLGNVREKSLSEIWQDEPYQQLRQQMRKLQLPECVSCIERNDYEFVSREIFSRE